MFLPAQQIDFLSGTRQKMTLLSSEAVPLVFSYLRSRSSFVFVFSEIPMFFAGKTLRFFAGYPAKNADFVVGSRSFCVFLFEEPLLFCFRILRDLDVFAGTTNRFFVGYPAKNADFVVGSRSFSIFLFKEPLLLCFSIWRDSDFFAGYPGKNKDILPGTRQKNADFVAGSRFFCVFLFEKLLLLCFPIRGKKIQFRGGSRSSCVFLAMTC